ncbi:primosomal protein [Aquipuribacter hungaricus]|uniref:Primosomal protein n=1 Tax=Aquipuribacter hungaricus TaxID=545624 RepID=A0ABV7WCU3_9MICO
MASDPRAALDRFVSALQRHFEAAASRRSELDPTVVDAYDELAAAFVAYDDALFDAFDEVTPFDLTDEDEDDDEYDEDEADEDEDEADEDETDADPAPTL